MKTRFDVTGANAPVKESTNAIQNDVTEHNVLKSGICEYKGIESVLPLGCSCLIPDWKPEDAIVKRWKVTDPKTDDGFRWKTTEELKSSDFIIAAEINLNTLNAIFETYGKNKFIQFTDTNNNKLTMNQWIHKYGSDPLGLLALKNIRATLKRR